VRACKEIHPRGIAPPGARPRGTSKAPATAEATGPSIAPPVDANQPRPTPNGILLFSRPNSSRRIALHDVLAYKEQRSRQRREALDEMTAGAVDVGVYDEAIGKACGSDDAAA
jgi:hypothetical protein